MSVNASYHGRLFILDENTARRVGYGSDGAGVNQLFVSVFVGIFSNVLMVLV